MKEEAELGPAAQSSPEEGSGGGAGTWTTRVTSLGLLNLSKPEVRKIDRYLHTTRAALLFARDVVLVEGIAESILLPVFASIIYAPATSVAGELSKEKDERDASNSQKSAWLRQFRSASIVAVDGVDFLPYLKLLLLGDTDRLDRLAVVTDADGDAGQARRTAYREAFADSVARKQLEVFVGLRTLEADLFAQSKNEGLLREAFLELHPRSQANWTAVADAAQHMTLEQRAEIFGKAIKTSSKADGNLVLDIGKGDFAQIVAEGALHFNNDGQSRLAVPAYIVDAIRFVAEK